MGIGWEGTWEFTATPCSSKNRTEKDVPRRGRKEKESRPSKIFLESESIRLDTARRSICGITSGHVSRYTR